MSFVDTDPHEAYYKPDVTASPSITEIEMSDDEMEVIKAKSKRPFGFARAMEDKNG